MRKVHPCPQPVVDTYMCVRQMGAWVKALEAMCTPVGRRPGTCAQAWGTGVPQCMVLGAGDAEAARVWDAGVPAARVHESGCPPWWSGPGLSPTESCWVISPPWASGTLHTGRR